MSDTAMLDEHGKPMRNPEYASPLILALVKIESYCQRQCDANSGEIILWSQCKQIASKALDDWQQT